MHRFFLHIVRSAGVMAWCLFAVSAVALQSVTGSSYEQGRAAFAAARWDEAASLMAKAEEENPGKSDALLYEGRALSNAKRFAEADGVLKPYVSAHPESANGLYLLAWVQGRENKPADSLATYTAAARLRPPTSDELTSVALDYVLAGDFPSAIKWLQKAVEFDPKNAEAWYSLGRCFYTQSRFTEADAAFRRALALDPERLKAAENLGLTLDAENRQADAETFFKQAVAMAGKGPNTDEWPYLDYANFLLDRERPADAVPLLKEAVAIAPQCAMCHEKLGRALAQTGDAQQGIAELEKAVALKPDEAHFHYELGLAYKQAGMMDKAKVELAESAKLYGSKDAGGRK
jgi:tetratricopeptide (TPR) repeat protein